MPDISYEDEYWGLAVDPDGNERNIMEEWDDQVENFRHIISYLDNSNSGNILDVGCGPGFFLSGLPPNWNRYGIDISREQLSFKICKCRNWRIADMAYEKITLML